MNKTIDHHAEAMETPASPRPAGDEPRISPGCDPRVPEKFKRQAAIVREFGTSSAMAATLDMGKLVEATGVKVYLDEFHRDAGGTADPVERIMLEQLAFAHHRLTHLHVQASKASDAQAITAYNGAAARLLAELRRLALAIQVYRGRGQPKSTVVTYRIQQQNVAQGGGKQDVAFNTDSQGESTRMVCRDTEVADTDGETNDGHDRFTPEEPESSQRRPHQRTEARAVV